MTERERREKVSERRHINRYTDRNIKDKRSYAPASYALSDKMLRRWRKSKGGRDAGVTEI